MNLLTWIDETTCVRLAQTLLHFLWQGVVIAVLAMIAVRWLRKASPNARYTLWTVALAVMAACPVVTFAVLGTEGLPVSNTAAIADPLSTEAAPLPLLGKTPGTLAPPTGNAPAISEPTVAARTAAVPLRNVTQTTPTTSWQRYTPPIILAYIICVAAMLGRLLIAVRGGQRLRKRSRPVDDAAILGAVARQAGALGLPVAPAIAYCEKVLVPTVVGIIRPMVLLPFALTNELSPQQIELLLAHELAHIRRYDHVVNILQRFVEAVLFFHPAIWFVSRRIRIEREHCCDELAVGARGSRVAYADSLVRMAELCSGHPASASLASAAALGAADRPSMLRLRILRLLEGASQPAVRLRRTWVALIAVTALAGFITAPHLRGEPPQPASSDQPAKTYPATLPSGITVELIGVSHHPAGESPWWKPDGSDLPDRPQPDPSYNVHPNESSRAYEFAARVTDPQGREPSVRWVIPTAQSTATGGSEKDSTLRFAAAALPKAAKTTTLRLGITAAPWTTLIATDKSPGCTSYGLEDASLVFAEPHESDGAVILTVAHTALEKDHRIVAVDTSGEVHGADRQNSSGTDALSQTTVHFRDLTLDQVKEFQVQVRPFEWVEFRNVSLDPGHRSDVEVLVNPPSRSPALDASGYGRTTGYRRVPASGRAAGSGVPGIAALSRAGHAGTAKPAVNITPTCILTGFVVDAATAKPIAGATVSDDGYGPKPHSTATTDANGKFRLGTWPEEHNIIVKAPGYQPQRHTLTTRDFRANKDHDLNFGLKSSEPSPPLTK